MRNVNRRLLSALLLSSLLSAAGAARGQSGRAPRAEGSPEERLGRVLARVGESVERYLGGMFSIAFTEVFRQEELRADLTPKGKSREFVFENIVLREPPPADGADVVARTVRRVKSVDGKPAKPGEAKKSGCTDPASSYGDPLSLFLPKNQARYAFSFEGETQLHGRKALALGFAPREPGRPGVTWKGNCFYVGAPKRGRVWVDAENFDVLQLEWRLIESFEFESPGVLSMGPLGRFGPSRKLRFERSDYTVRFRRVQFNQPDQVLLLPESSESLMIMEGASRPRVRGTQSFTNYRRFVSDVKVIEDTEPEN